MIIQVIDAIRRDLPLKAAPNPFLYCRKLTAACVAAAVRRTSSVITGGTGSTPPVIPITISPGAISLLLVQTGTVIWHEPSL